MLLAASGSGRFVTLQLFDVSAQRISGKQAKATKCDGSSPWLFFFGYVWRVDCPGQSCYPILSMQFPFGGPGIYIASGGFCIPRLQLQILIVQGVGSVTL